MSATNTRKTSSLKGRKSGKTKRRIATTAIRSKRSSVSSLSKELKEAREQQAATADILKVIASSPSDVQPVFEAIATSANRLIGGYSTAVFRFIDGIQHLKAFTPTTPAADEILKSTFPMPLANIPLTNSKILNGENIQVEDTETGEEFQVRLGRARGFRSIMFTPLMYQGTAIGVISVTRRETGRFADHHVQLLKTFADQAVIAIENVRLFNETQEALERQTATADVLRVIASSPDDVQPVFDSIAASANRLIGGLASAVFLFTEGMVQLKSLTATSAEADEALKSALPRKLEDYSPAQIVECGEIAQVADTEQAPEAFRNLGRIRGYRSVVYAPLMNKGVSIGMITIARAQLGTFPEHHVQLLKTFADQAVIAIENTRLFNETKEALARQTATADVLKVIASSPSNLQPVFNAIAERSNELVGGHSTTVFRFNGDVAELVATTRVSEEADALLRAAFPRPISTMTDFERIVRGEMAETVDTEADTETEISRTVARARGFRSRLMIPLKSESSVIGTISITRQEPGAFAEKDVELLRTFADQAVIAISNVELFQQVQNRTKELSEALQFQTAASDVLKVISRSPDQLQPLLDAIVETSRKLCGSDASTIFLLRDRMFHFAALAGTAPPNLKDIRTNPMNVDAPGSLFGRLLQQKRTLHFANVMDDPELSQGRTGLGGPRALLVAPLLNKGEVIGAIVLRQSHLKPFTERQIQAIEVFADQAVIAISNVGLFEEVQARTRDLQESLEQQTATADVLKVISGSAFDLGPVLQTVVSAAVRLCRADQATIYREENGEYRWAADHSLAPDFERIERNVRIRPGTGTLVGRVALNRDTVQILDAWTDPLYEVKEDARVGGVHTMLGVPLLRDGLPIGVIGLARQKIEPYTEKEIGLVRTFADQAVIAIENARLFEELHERTADLARSVDELTATGDVLKTISRSSVDLATVLDTLVETVTRLCRADQAYMVRRRGDIYDVVAERGLSEEAGEYFRTGPVALSRGTIRGRVALECRAVHISDVLQDPEYTHSEGQRLAAYRTILGIPLLREETLIGEFIVARTRVEPFTDKEIELATTFADQAVIAIENARLFEELRERQAELRATFDNMGDGVAMFGADKHLAAWNCNLQELLDLPDALLIDRPSFAELFCYLAERGEFGSTDLEAELSRSLEDASREMRYERTRPDGRVIEVRRNPVPDGGFVLIYADITERKRAEEAIRAARDAAEVALRDLQAAQASLVHAQKMAALGQLTAGIAHEIKNPLNFVNNFAALSSELTDELSDALKPVALPGKVREEVDELAGTLKDNLGRVVQHGKRADSIVKNMLLHSREGSGEHRPVEINAIIDESLNLAYHGARAEKQGFNITLERDFDPAVGVADIYPQEVTRVLLNLISNGFYAATQRAVAAGSGFEPRLEAVTRNLGDRIEVRIRDNGMGIPPDIQEKIFNPFFTTKPAGEGTGLGLSLSHDIVVKQHGGTIDVLTEPGSFTEFIIRLPRAIPA